MEFLPARLLGAVILIASCFAPASPARSQEHLSREARLAGQRAIESVYQRHRTWPRENRRARPALAELMPEAALGAKVDESLRKSRALEVYWGRPITGPQLQAEMDRMARATRDPEILRELWRSLDDDPRLVAECLARPLLAGRLLRSWYAFDRRRHGELRARIEREVEAVTATEGLRGLSGAYGEREWIKQAPAEARAARRDCGSATALSLVEWERLLARLGEVRCRGASPLGRLPALREDPDRFYVEAILERSPDRVKVATVEWRKRRFEEWWRQVRAGLDAELLEPAAGYRLPSLVQGPVCEDDTWAPTAGVPERSGHTAVWTGSEMLVWGGCISQVPCATNTGSRYDPATDTWTPMSDVNAPAARGNHTAIWTGSRMIVWGGWDFSSNESPLFDSGGRYDPATDTWTPTSTTGAPGKRFDHTTVWTGSEMIVWGGQGCLDPVLCLRGLLNTGGRYDPTTDSWQPTDTNPLAVPEARTNHSAIWTGSRMVVWGGESDRFYLDTGGLYDPATNTWTMGGTSTTNVPGARSDHAAIWTGSRMVVWGGYANGSLGTGAIYDPITNVWLGSTSSSNAPDARYGHSAVWTGSRMIVWGGYTDEIVNTGGRYDPVADTWQTTNAVDAPGPRENQTAVWTGSEMIIWGGSLIGSFLATGGRYDPATDSWIPTGTMGAPPGRDQHTAVWTGAEMLVWGGCGTNACGISFPNPSEGPTGTGARYDPATDTWAAMTTDGAPRGRRLHTAVWTGTEMIIWGGDPFDGFQTATGGRYDPGSDTWTPTSRDSAPALRADHVAVWTGNEMIVWGGYSCDQPEPCSSAPFVDTGGRYDPSTDSWRPTSTVNAATRRAEPSAVWTGREMIVWGGYGCTNPPACDNNSALDTGARYDPTLDSWTAVGNSGAPDPRTLHTAVWTGREMIVWGAGHYEQDNTGGRYDPASDRWTPTTLVGAPEKRFGHTAVWTGSEMIVWGGSDLDLFGAHTGGRYDPAADSWRPTSTEHAPGDRAVHTAVWTGSRMIVWGGSSITETATGGLYCALAQPTPVLVSLAEARSEPGRVTLVWHVADTRLAATLYRREEGEAWVPLALLRADGGGVMAFEDRDVRPGGRYGYRLGIALAGSEVFEAEIWLDVPRALALDVHGGRNPVTNDPEVWFSLPGVAPARLELMDVAGRRVLSREVGAYGAGSHQMRLNARPALAQGLYLLRLSQGGRAASAKLMIVR